MNSQRKESVPKPHHTGSPLKLWGYLLFNTMVSGVTALMIVHALKQLVVMFTLGVSREIDQGGAPQYILMLFFFSMVAMGWRAPITLLLSFAAEYVGAKVLGIATLCVGLFERARHFNGGRLYRAGRTVAAMLVGATLVLAWDSLGWAIDQRALGWISSIFFTLAIFFAFSLAPLVLGRSDDWKSLAERVRLHVFEPVEAGAGGYTEVPFIHLSDLHVTHDDTAPLAENIKWTVRDATLEALARSMQALDGLPVIISGDTTDTGDAREWGRFKDHFGAFADRMIVAPGNHDLNIVGYDRSGLLNVADLLHHEGRIDRLRAYLDSAAALMGARVRSAQCGAHGKPVALRSLADAYAEIGKTPGSLQFQKLNALFPLVVRVPTPHVVMHAIVWNTTRTSSMPALNSLGKIDPGQLERLSGILALLEHESGAPPVLIHVLHHKVGMPAEMDFYPGELSDREHRIQFASMTMQNAAALLRKLGQLDADTVIFHGHHHVRFAARVANQARGAIDVISAPSSTLVCEGHVRHQIRVATPGFDIVSVGVGVNRSGTRLVRQPDWQACVAEAAKAGAAVV